MKVEPQLRRFIPILVFLLIALTGCAVLFSEYFASGFRTGWLSVIAVEIRAACRDPGTQWMLFLCAGIYFVTFTLLAGRFRSSGRESAPNFQMCEPTHVGCYWILGRQLSNPDLWLCGFLLIVALTYALDYQTASASTQALMLMVGAACGKGVATWVLWKSERRAPARHVGVQASACSGSTPGQQFQRAGSETGAPIETIRAETALGVPAAAHINFLLSILVLLLAGAALWQPEMTMEFQYRGVRRWSGPWDNPNIYGMLMGVGLVLAVGMIVQSLKSKIQSPCQKEKHSTSNIQRSTTNRGWLRWVTTLLFAGAAALCGIGLFKSYSRGAWLGAVIGFAYLLWQSSKAESTNQKAGIAGDCATRNAQHATRPSGFRFPLSRFPLLRPVLVIVASVLVLAFWQFRHTEWPPARRVFSVANVNDFSWRNRVTTWQGALQMMADRPLLGFGWGKAEDVYRYSYRARRLDETAAIQLNDYLMLGVSAGIPALLCVVAYAWLGTSRRWKIEIHQKAGESFRTAFVCRSGALVLLVGFWFDGGLFKLPTAAIFWTLLELGRLSPREWRSTETVSNWTAHKSATTTAADS